jgi:hypothetical protein
MSGDRHAVTRHRYGELISTMRRTRHAKMRQYRASEALINETEPTVRSYVGEGTKPFALQYKGEMERWLGLSLAIGW